MKRIFFLIIISLSVSPLVAQELRARISVVTSRVDNSVNKNTFQTLKTSLNDFINSRKWSNDNFKVNEKIDCSFLLNIESTNDPDIYKHPDDPVRTACIHSTYLSPVINYQDNDLTFKSPVSTTDL